MNLFKCLHNEILTYKYNNYRYICNYCARDYSQVVLHRKEGRPKVGMPYFCDWKPGRFRTTSRIRWMWL